MIRELWLRLVGIFFPKRAKWESQNRDVNPPEKIQEEDRLILRKGSDQEEMSISAIQGKEEEEISLLLSEQASSVNVENPRWKIHPVKPREFYKVGRLFMEGGDLVIKIDGLPFHVISAGDHRKLMDGEIIDIRETGNHNSVGIARPSASGRGVNFRIGGRFFTVPYRNFWAVVEEKARKAAMFEGNG